MAIMAMRGETFLSVCFESATWPHGTREASGRLRHQAARGVDVLDEWTRAAGGASAAAPVFITPEVSTIQWESDPETGIRKRHAHCAARAAPHYSRTISFWIMLAVTYHKSK